MLSWIFGAKRPTVEHNDPETRHLDVLPGNTEFIREGSGETVIDGSVGPNSLLIIRDNAKVRIMGDIGRGCSIHKEGSGTLKILGAVADDLKLAVYGRGTVSFTQKPPEFVINTISNRGGAAKIICGVEEIQQRLAQGHLRHNLGVFPERADRELPVHSTPLVRQASPVQPLPAPPMLRPAPRESEPVDQYDAYTEQYIDNYRKRKTKTVKERIDELHLTAKEEEMFGKFTDCIFDCPFEDVPVLYHDKYYDLSTLLDLYRLHKPDPYTRLPLKLVHIQSALPLLEELDKTIAALHKQRAATKEIEENQSRVDSSMTF